MIQLFAEEMLMVALQPGMPPEFDHLAFGSTGELTPGKEPRVMIFSDI